MELIFALWAVVSEIRAIFKIAIFGYDTWPLVKVPEVTHILPLCGKGSKLSLILLYGQRFPRYGPIFKIVIFGHETWPMTKVPHILHFAPELIFNARATVKQIQHFFLPNYAN